MHTANFYFDVIGQLHLTALIIFMIYFKPVIFLESLKVVMQFCQEYDN